MKEATHAERHNAVLFDNFKLNVSVDNSFTGETSVNRAISAVKRNDLLSLVRYLAPINCNWFKNLMLSSKEKTDSSNNDLSRGFEKNILLGKSFNFISWNFFSPFFLFSKVSDKLDISLSRFQIAFRRDIKLSLKI